MRLEFLLYALIFVLIGLMMVSFFLVWKWYDAKDRLGLARESSRDQTALEIRHVHNKCRVLLYISLALTLCYVPIPFILGEYYGTLAYPGVVMLADALMLFGLRARTKHYLSSLNRVVAENEQHIREVQEEKERARAQMLKEAPELNKQAEKVVYELFGGDYELWFRHDILLSKCVLVNREMDLMYAQGTIIKLSEIMEVRQGRLDLKLVTSNSMHPFVVIDFGALTINPETGNRYLEEIGSKLGDTIIP